jgi:hypothetical protein
MMAVPMVIFLRANLASTKKPPNQRVFLAVAAVGGGGALAVKGSEGEDVALPFLLFARRDGSGGTPGV